MGEANCIEGIAAFGQPRFHQSNVRVRSGAVRAIRFRAVAERVALLGNFEQCTHPIHIVVGQIAEQSVHSWLEVDCQSTCSAGIEL